jgi:hypothetical protein
MPPTLVVNTSTVLPPKFFRALPPGSIPNRAFSTLQAAFYAGLAGLPPPAAFDDTASREIAKVAKRITANMPQILDYTGQSMFWLLVQILLSKLCTRKPWLILA